MPDANLKRKSVGFIGLGNAGQPMAMRLLDAGYELVVRDLRPEAEEPLIKRGAKSGKSSAEAVGDITITVLATPSEVEKVYFGPEGLLEGLTRPGQIVIESTGIDPETTLQVEKAVKERGGRFLACTLMASGAPSVSIPRGLLNILVGGERSCIKECLDLFKALAQTVVCAPDTITPKLLKLAIIMMSSAREIAAMEAALWLKRCGVNPLWFIRLLEETDRSENSRNLKVLMSGGLRLGGNVRNSHKDLTLALQLASEKDLPLPLMACAHQILQACKGAGFTGKSTSESLLALQERTLGETLPTSWNLDLKELLPEAHPVRVLWLEQE